MLSSEPHDSRETKYTVQLLNLLDTPRTQPYYVQEDGMGRLGEEWTYLHHMQWCHDTFSEQGYPDAFGTETATVLDTNEVIFPGGLFLAVVRRNHPESWMRCGVE